MIRVAIADDQAIVRAGLRGLIELAPGMSVAGEAATGEEALELVAREHPDVLLLDVRMPKLSGLEVLRRLADDGPRAIILTTFPDEEVLVETLRLGAGGYLLKDAGLEEIVAAIEAVHAGELVLRPRESSTPLPGLEHLRRGRRGPFAGELSARERQILRLMGTGLSNKEIAHALGNAEGTIKNHVSNILAKLHARDRVQAVLHALEHGLI